VPLAITYGYSRDHREDLKQWMLALASTHDGDIPSFLRPLNGNSSDKEHLSAAVKEVMTQLREQLPEEQEQRLAVFDSGGYSEANMKSYNDAKIWWISRIPETSTAAKTALEQVYQQWQPLSDGSGDYVVRLVQLLQGKERWVIVRTHAQMQATKEHMEKKVKKTHQEWEKRLWHLSNQAFGCQMDAQSAWEKALTGKPSWLIATFILKEQKQYQQGGRPKKEARADQTAWSLVPTLAVDRQEVTALAKKASFIVATNILDAQRLPHEQWISTYKEQGGVERGFRFLKDPFFLASSVFLKKPERVIALPLRDGALAVVPASNPRFWGCKLFIGRFFVYLVPRIRTSIFSPRKLRIVGNMLSFMISLCKHIAKITTTNCGLWVLQEILNRHGEA